jgi:hypothetical protein
MAHLPRIVLTAYTAMFTRWSLKEERISVAEISKKLEVVPSADQQFLRNMEEHDSL